MATKEIQSLFPTIRQFMEDKPIERAWLFGSCSRGENTPDSDVDILVEYSSGQRLSLFGVAKLMSALSREIGRKVDLVEEGRLMPFAVDGVNNDKMLIYERAH